MSVTSNAFSADGGATISYGNRAAWLSPLDFDADGRLDLYWRVDLDGDGDDDGDQGRLFAGDGAGDITNSAALDAIDRDGVRQYLDADTEFHIERDYVDLNGDGVMDYVELGGDGYVYKTDADLLAGKPLRLLNRIDNGAGGITEVRYRASTDRSIDMPGTDDRLGMPTHTWVVDTLTRSDVADAIGTTGTVTGTTTYRYGRPIYNAGIHPTEVRGRYGFRGFERVQVTSPLGGVTESVHDYSLDWSGRLVETSVFANASDLAAGRPDSIEQTTWQPFTLFCPGNEPAQPDEDFLFFCPTDGQIVPAISYQPVDRKTWTCANGDARADCLASGALRVETTEWFGKSAETDPDGLQLLFFPRVTWKKRADAVQDGDRRHFDTHALYSGPDFYRLRPTTENTHERIAGQLVQRAQRVHFWSPDTSGHDGAFEVSTRDHLESGATATHQRGNDLGLGLVTRRRKPEQYQQSLELWTYLAYDPSFPVHPTSSTNELGHVVLTEHDLGTGALLAERGPNALSCGTGCTEYAGTRTEVDGFGRPLKVYAMTEDPADGTYREILVQRFTYRDDLLPHRVVEERRIDWNGSDFTKMQTEFDGFGRLQERFEFRFESGQVDPLERFRYDAQGNIDRVQVRDPSLDTSATVVYQYLFDALDRPTEVERPDGTRVTWTYDGLATTRREVAATGPEAETTTTKDVFGRLEKVDERIEASTLATTLYSWDANDNLRRVEKPDGLVTLLSHDWMSRRTSITRGSRTWAYTYDLNSNLVAERVPVPGDNPVLYNEYTTVVSYDALDRPTSRLIGGRQMPPAVLEDLGVSTITFSYDQGQNGIGRLTTVANPIWTRTYEHDARGNLIEDSLHFDLEPSLGVAIEDTRTLTRTFNPLGAAVDEWHGDGTTLSGSTHTTTTYNRRGLPETLSWQQMTPVVLATATRNGAGLLKTLGDGPITQTWTHDSLGRVLSMQAASTAATPQTQISEALTYYGADDPESLATFRHGLGTRNFTFSFDDRHQLTSAFDDAGYSASFGYRSDGRLDAALVNAPGGAPLAPTRDVTYVYPTVAEVTLDPEAVKELRAGPVTAFLTYGFDSAGNVTSRGDGPGGQQDLDFIFDGDDQQRIATQVPVAGLPIPSAGDHELYYYDHSGQRVLAVSRLASGVVTRAHLWLGSLEVEYAASGTVTQTLAHLALDRPVARIENLATAKRVVHGQLGHFLGAFTPDAAALDVAFVYGPFGEILAQSGADPADYTHRFNGKEQDALTSLSYYGARYFDPLSLTWTQADPLYRFAPDLAWDEPRRANLYAFTLNNPLAMVDPDGRQPRPPGGRMGPGGGVGTEGEAFKRGGVLLLNRTATLVASLPFVPHQVRVGAAFVAAATDEGGPPLGVSDLANVDPASLPGPPGGPGGVAKPPSGKPGTTSGKTSLIDRKAFAKERATYWKNEAKNNPGKYSKEDLAKMQKGRAPTGSDGHPTELHHKDQKPDEVQPMTRTEHRLGENYKKNHPPQKKE